MSPADLDFVAAMLGDPEVMRFYPKCYSRRGRRLDRCQRRRYARHGHGLWLALEKATGQPVGQIGLLIQTVGGVEEKEVGYLIHRPFWRRGFATEAAQACLDHAFTALARRRVIALVRPENTPSLGVARKLGMLRRIADRATRRLHAPGVLDFESVGPIERRPSGTKERFSWGPWRGESRLPPRSNARVGDQRPPLRVPR